MPFSDDHEAKDVQNRGTQKKNNKRATGDGDLTDAGGTGGPPGKKQRRKVRRNSKRGGPRS